MRIGARSGDSELEAARLSIVATPMLLTLQGWTGDFVNVFVTSS